MLHSWLTSCVEIKTALAKIVQTGISLRLSSKFCMKKKYNSTIASLICLYYGIAICDFVMLLYALMNETTGSLSIFFYSFLNCWYYKTSNMVHRSLVFMLSVNDCYRRLVLHNLITGRGVSRFFSILNDDNLWQPSFLTYAFYCFCSISLLLSQISNGMFNTFVNFAQISIFVDMSLFFWLISV